MSKLFSPDQEWRSRIPVPVYDGEPELNGLYWKAWELAHDHLIDLPGMPQTPYMDEAFCDTDIWIWDTCFMALFCKYAQSRFPGVESLHNFYDVLYGGKTLPRIITKNAPAWTGEVIGREAQVRIHIFDNPPLFAWTEYRNALFSGDREHVRELLLEKQYLQRHFRALENLTERTVVPFVRNQTCWIRHENGYFWEGGRSGMDNTPRGRTGEHALEERPNHPRMLWIAAIAQQGLAAHCIAELAEIIGEERMASEWRAEFERLRNKVNAFYWDPADGCYYDIHADSSGFMKVLTPASFWPLVSGMASAEQADRMCRLLEDPALLGGERPCVSLSRSDPDFNAETGHYWRGSIWVPTAYAAIKGIERYGHYELAERTARNILLHMSRTYREYEPHTIWECYNPNRPEPARSCDEANRVVRPDFCGWSALAPIGLYLENVIGIHSVDAFRNTVRWALPETARPVGVRNLRFGETVADLVCENGTVNVTANRPFMLYVNEKEFAVPAGSSVFQ